MQFQNGSNKVEIELRVVQFWSEIIRVISNRTCATRSFDFEITRMISDQIPLSSITIINQKAREMHYLRLRI